MSIWGAIAGAAPAAVGGIVGGILNKKAADNATQANRDINAENINTQREFAQHGIRWRVDDAKAAGIHPLVALGAQPSSFSPSSIGVTPDTSMGNMAANMGQDISRAISATRTSEERAMASLQLQSAQLDIEGKALDNQIRASQLRKLNSPNPQFPGGTSESFIPGQGSSGGLIKTKPMERTASMKGAPHSEPGAINDLGWAKTATGIVPVPSKDVKERIEDNFFHETGHFIRNNVMPNLGDGPRPPASALPKGATKWKWNYLQQEYQPYYPPRGGSRGSSWDMRSKKMQY